MAKISDPVLLAEHISGRAGRRRLHISYQLHVDQVDLLMGAATDERATIRSRDLHDAPVAPEPLSVDIEQRGRLNGPGTHERHLFTEVNRSSLDVERDWWRTDHGGGVEPIAELADHLQADIVVSIEGEVVAQATTPVLTGSWGALGRD